MGIINFSHLELGQVQPQKKKSKMQQNLKYLIVCLAVVGISASPSEVVDSETKAASPLINCGCQCSPLTFRDAKGEVQGNCLTVDSTGAQWCYVDTSYSSCADLVPSLRFPNNPWSYEACATPAPGSLLCPALANPILPAVVPS